MHFDSVGGGGGGTEMRLNLRCNSNCVFSIEFIFVSPGDGIEFVFVIVVVEIVITAATPSFEVVLSIWLSSELGIGMSTKHTGSFIPFAVCASLIFSELVAELAASTEIIPT